MASRRPPRWLTPNYPFRDWYDDPSDWSFWHDYAGHFGYFAFVEEVASPNNPDAFEGPDGERRALPEGAGHKPVRFRLAGVQTRAFIDIIERFEELDPDTVSAEQRSRRSVMLNELVRPLPIPLIDVFVPSEGDELVWLRSLLRPGSWHAILIVEGGSSTGGPSVLVGAPELPLDDSYDGRISLIGPVPLQYLRRLKDIFSLIHISDADFGIEGEGGAEPTPPEPDDGGPSDPAMETVVEEVEIEAEIVATEPARRQMMQRRAEELPLQLYLRE